MNNNRIFTLTILVNLLYKGALTISLGFQEVTILYDPFFFVILFCITKPCTSLFPKTYIDAWELRQNKKQKKKNIFLIIQFVFSFLQIYSLVLQGRINDVRELLAQHPEKQPGKYDVRISLGFYCVDLQLHWAGLSLKRTKGQGPGISPSYNKHDP